MIAEFDQFYQFYQFYLFYQFYQMYRKCNDNGEIGRLRFQIGLS
jgi:hypothetical protein